MSRGDRVVGYVGPPGLSDSQAWAAERQIRDYARKCGWRLHELFVEFDHSLLRSQFEEMVADLRGARVDRVVIPSIQHLASNPLIQNLMVERLESELGVDLHVLDETLDAYEHDVQSR